MNLKAVEAAAPGGASGTGSSTGTGTTTGSITEFTLRAVPVALAQRTATDAKP